MPSLHGTGGFVMSRTGFYGSGLLGVASRGTSNTGRRDSMDRCSSGRGRCGGCACRDSRASTRRSHRTGGTRLAVVQWSARVPSGPVTGTGRLSTLRPSGGALRSPLGAPRSMPDAPLRAWRGTPEIASAGRRHSFASNSAPSPTLRSRTSCLARTSSRTTRRFVFPTLHNSTIPEDPS